MSHLKLSTAVIAVVAISATAAAAREEIRRVGSSTVFPYTQAVAEQFANNTGFPSPIVESTADRRIDWHGRWHADLLRRYRRGFR